MFVENNPSSRSFREIVAFKVYAKNVFCIEQFSRFGYTLIYKVLGIYNFPNVSKRRTGFLRNFLKVFRTVFM